jgi:myo-inositol-1(or 4)-monophosphatase
MEEGAREDSSGRVARFIVDPLDGTTNFLRGLPHFSVSLALEMEGEVRVGVVFDPCKGDVFWAEEGQGAWLGDRRLSVSRETDLARSIVGTGIPHRGRGNHAAYLEALKRVMHEVAGIRRLGSAALDLAYVAAGRFDAFFEWGLSPWDVAAGMLLVREAGGVVTRGDGSPTALDSADVLAVPSESMQRRLVPLLAPFYS